MMSVATDAGEVPESGDHAKEKRTKRRKKAKNVDERLDTTVDTVIDVEGGTVEPVQDEGRSLPDPKSEVEGDESTKSRKKKKRRKAELVQSGEVDVGNEQNEFLDTQKKKDRRSKSKDDSRRRSSMTYPEDPVLGELSRHLGEDMVDATESAGDHDTALTSAQGVWHTDVTPSQVGTKLFVESNGAFKAIDRQKWVTKNSRPLPPVPTSNKTSADPPTAVRAGLKLHACIQKLADYCHGLLGGVALWQCIMVYQLSGPQFDKTDFLLHYCPLAAAAQTMFYLLLVVCIFALMARCDVSGDGSLWALARCCDCRLVALLVYMATLVLSLTAANVDDALATSCRHGGHANETLNYESIEQQIPMWTNLNLCRCLGALLAYLFLSLSTNPRSNILEERLRLGAEQN